MARTKAFEKKERERDKTESGAKETRKRGTDEAAVSSGLALVQCKIQPLILKRFANQPRHCSPVKARDFLGGGREGAELIVF